MPYYGRFAAVLDVLRKADGHAVIHSDVLDYIDRENELATGLELERKLLAKLKRGQDPLAGVLKTRLSPYQTRRVLIEKFNNDPACKVFFSTDAGGVGLNLQAAFAVINFEPPWNPARLEQRIGRVRRLGQSRSVHVVHMLRARASRSACGRR